MGEYDLCPTFSKFSKSDELSVTDTQTHTQITSVPVSVNDPAT